MGSIVVVGGVVVGVFVVVVGSAFGGCKTQFSHP